MCTCVAFRKNGLYFGRNMDLEYSFGEKIVATPKNFPLRSISDEHNGFMGTAAVIDGYPLYADAMNEKGLCVAGLDFPLNNLYRSAAKDKVNVPAYDFIAYVCAKYSSVDELKQDFLNINITNENFSEEVFSPTLHWMVSDAKSSVVIESTEHGSNLYENPLDVMTNLPEFPQQSENYERIKCGKGSAQRDLRSTLSSETRFARMAYFRGNNFICDRPEKIVSHVYRMLDAVSVPDFSSKTSTGKYRKTTYSVCFDVPRQKYLIKTYENSRISMVSVNENMFSAAGLSVFNISTEQDYFKVN